MKGKNAIAKILKMEGVEFISGFPYNEVFESAAEEGIRCIATRTERIAVNIADAYTRVSNSNRVVFAPCNLARESKILFQAWHKLSPILFRF